jgi:membrane protein YqaA with SNARE-associated domain
VSKQVKPVLRKLYNAALVHAGRPDAERWLAGVAFVDGALFPLPPELLQLPMSIARPERSLRYALFGTLASAFGAVVAYVIGALLFRAIGVPLLHFAGREAEFAQFGAEVAANWLLWPVAFLLAPMPAAVAAGSIHIGVWFAVLASVVGRGARFLAIAVLLKLYGVHAQRLIERYFHHLAIATAVLLGGFVVVRYAL